MTTQLAEELVQVERDIVAIRLKTEEKLEQQREKMVLVRARRKELIAAHKKALAEYQEEHTRALESVCSRARQEIENAQASKEDAIRRRREAELGTTTAEQASRELEHQVKALHQQLDRCKKAQEQRYQEAISAADELVRTKAEDADEAVRRQSILASYIQESSVQTVEDLQAEVRAKSAEFPPMSIERSRFPDLYAVFSKRSGQVISSDEFEKSRIDILEAWHGDFLQTTQALDQHTKAKLEAQRSATVPPGRPRSIEGARRRAEGRIAYMTSRGKPLPLESRPKTAP